MFSKLDTFKTTKLHPNKFDFILHSIETLYSNCEISKFATNNIENEITCDIELIKCGCKILEHLIHRNKEENDAFLGFFLNAIKSFHNQHKCSTKTAICFTILLWKRISNSNDSLSPRIIRKFSLYLKLILNHIIDSIKTDAELVIYINQSDQKSLAQQNLKIDRSINLQFLHGLCRQDDQMKKVLEKLVEKHQQFGKKFVESNIYIHMTHRSSILEEIVSENMEFNFKVENGVIIKLENELNIDENLIHNAIVFDSSLVYGYVHLGFNKDVKIEKYKTNCDDLGDYGNLGLENWKLNVTNILKKFNVKLLFVRDRIDNDLQQFCDSESIIVFSNIDLKLFSFIKKSLNPNSLLYVEDFDETNLLKIKVELIKSTRLVNNYLKLMNPQSDSSEKFTVLVETRFKVIMSMLKEFIIHNFKRLENVLSDGFYLKGAGFIELNLSEKIIRLTLEEMTNSLNLIERDEDDISCFYLAKETLANTFRDLYVTVRATNEDVFDDYKSKTEAWILGISMNNIFLNSDLSICY